MSKVATTFMHELRMLMEKHDHSVEDVAQLANTCTFVARRWYNGTASPSAHIRREVLNALDDPATERNRARGWQGNIPAAFA